ncbi:MAG TPA: SDR family oxidoreductase [Trebonia sp.]|nr:SDR family oxidoreductase [Trebonia sp.]
MSSEPLARDRTFLITGGNTGIGLATATALAAGGGRVYIACRDPERGKAAVAAIKSASGSNAVSLLPLDLGSLNSVRACAEAFLVRDEPLHILVNNAGVGGARGRTADGFEAHFGVNHLGHFALTMLLLDRLKASGPGCRVVNVSSQAHYAARGIDWAALRQKTRSFTGMREYGVSKLCNVLFTQELARRLGGTGAGTVADVTSYALHPGVVASDIWRRIPQPFRALYTRRMITTEEGAQTSLYCSTSPRAADESGLFYDKSQPVAASPIATPELAELLWKQSTEWTGVG